MKISRTSRVVVPQMVQLCSTEQCLRFCTPQCKHRIETAAIRCRGRHRRERSSFLVGARGEEAKMDERRDGEPECHQRRRASRTPPGALVIGRVVQKDAGKYQCIVRNSIGETRIESALAVTAPLQVTVLPQYQVLSTGEEATFRCNVTGYPVHTMAWLKDQRPIVATDRVQFSSRDVLHIASLRREDRGMYQCFVYNDNGGAQGTVELKISDVPPSIVSAFSEQTLEPGRWCP
ncbi:down syndrome cell adhesion molecule-like protein Dscam2 [Caerostris extrusa]|uniref:Down syndrome cell adhesion molecule-like protein Dscam2 n=1 Tax=Caerostris extrusa TaxID=172846 RepID=A0AAV4M358_CAEEX|nr:down syndrome cell adhesion molecule-like protein Dscam2 [Caerostris extrusa]